MCCACVLIRVGEERGAALLLYFLATAPSTLTGIVVSDDAMAGLVMGASTVRMPSGEREDVTFSKLAVGGRLERSRNTHV